MASGMRMFSPQMVNVFKAATITAIAGGYVYLHMQGSSSIKTYFQLYKEGRPVQMNEKLQDLCKSVLDEAQIPSKNKDAFKFFITAGDEPVFFGYSTFGSIAKVTNSFVGLPWSFQYDSVDQLDPEQIGVLVDYDVPWNTKNGKSLLESLIFSDSAKKFAIMRQIHMSNSYGVHFHTFNLILAFLTYNGMTHFQQSRLDKIAVARHFKILLTSIRIVFSVTLFYFLRDVIRHGIEVQADLKAVETGDEYYNGAIEFYSQLLRKNKAIAFFLGDEGKKYFTPAGDLRPPLYQWFLKPFPLPSDTRLQTINERFAHFKPKDEPIM